MDTEGAFSRTCISAYFSFLMPHRVYLPGIPALAADTTRMT
jgi:hypothetical protein